MTAMGHALSHFTPGGLGFALGLTLMAGLATGLGSLLALFAKRTNLRLLAWSLAFSAGAMLCVSFMEILPKANASLARSFGSSFAGWLAAGGFLAGVVAMAIIDALVPHHEPPADDDLQRLEAPGRATVLPAGEQRRLRRMGLFTALAVAIHNFPEGVATFLAAMEDPRTGVAIALAVALHNVPEGVSVSAPIFYATGSRARAFVYSFLSGLTEPLGGLFAAMTLDWLLPPHAWGWCCQRRRRHGVCVDLRTGSDGAPVRPQERSAGGHRRWHGADGGEPVAAALTRHGRGAGAAGAGGSREEGAPAAKGGCAA